MAELNESIKSIIHKHLENVKKEMAERMQSSGRNASGRTVASLAILEEGETKMALTGAEQWKYMEHGRGPGSVPSNFRDVIKQWIGVKHISITPKQGQSMEAALNSAAFVISRSIMQNGTSLHRKGGHDDIYSSLLEQEIEKMSAEVSSSAELNIDTIIDNYINDNGGIIS